MRKLYNFPTNSAAGQTVAILSETGYHPADIRSSLGSLPTITDVTVDASNDGSADPETTQDICIAASAAPGAAIAAYFTLGSQQGWVDLIGRVVHPSAGDPVCSVLSSSFYVADGDDAASLTGEGISTSWLTAVHQAFQDAAIMGVTICIASGDTGTESKLSDGKAHVQYPGSDPWVLAVGGTTIGNVTATSFEEWMWNDNWGRHRRRHQRFLQRASRVSGGCRCAGFIKRWPRRTRGSRRRGECQSQQRLSHNRRRRAICRKWYKRGGTSLGRTDCRDQCRRSAKTLVL